jgi:hypothetical protein
MQDDEVLAYVKSAARLQGLPLTEERARAVAAHFARTIAIARVLEQAPLAPEDEPAQLYLPAPFPAEDA